MLPVNNVLTVIPSPASCSASVLNAASVADRSALDSISTPIGSRTEVEAIPTIRPQRRSRIPGPPSA